MKLFSNDNLIEDWNCYASIDENVTNSIFSCTGKLSFACYLEGQDVVAYRSGEDLSWLLLHIIIRIWLAIVT
jgi:hypothetical protein